MQTRLKYYFSGSYTGTKNPSAGARKPTPIPTPAARQPRRPVSAVLTAIPISLAVFLHTAESNSSAMHLSPITQLTE